MSDPRPSLEGQIEAASWEDVERWEGIATAAMGGWPDECDEFYTVTDPPAVLALIALARQERDRADEMTKSWRIENKIADLNERENTKLRELLGQAERGLREIEGWDDVPMGIMDTSDWASFVGALQDIARNTLDAIKKEVGDV